MSLASIHHRNASYDEIKASLSAVQSLVHSALLQCGTTGATRHELAERLERPLATICGRVAELEEAGLVRSTEQKRPTIYGKTATVVVAITPPRPKHQTFLFD